MEGWENKMSSIKTKAVVVGVVGATVGGAYLLGNYNANNDNAQQFTKSMQNQIIAEKGLGHNLKAERFVETVEQQTELILTTENGMSNIKIEKHADSWNKWLTTSTIDVTVEYNAKVSIKTDDITFIQTDKGLTVIVDQDDIEVTSVEIVNKNCIMGRSIFGQGFSEDEKIVLEKQMIKSVREQILSDKNSMQEAKSSLINYLIETGNNFGVDIELIVK